MYSIRNCHFLSVLEEYFSKCNYRTSQLQIAGKNGFEIYYFHKVESENPESSRNFAAGAKDLYIFLKKFLLE